MATLETWTKDDGTWKIEVRELESPTAFAAWTSQEFKSTPLGWTPIGPKRHWSDRESAQDPVRRRGYTRSSVEEI